MVVFLDRLMVCVGPTGPDDAGCGAAGYSAEVWWLAKKLADRLVA